MILWFLAQSFLQEVDQAAARLAYACNEGAIERMVPLDLIPLVVDVSSFVLECVGYQSCASKHGVAQHVEPSEPEVLLDLLWSQLLICHSNIYQ